MNEKLSPQARQIMKVIAQKLREVFCKWIDNGHNDFNDINTIILRVELTDGLLLSHGTRYEF